MKVRNPSGKDHRVGGVLFPAGVVVECDEALARFVISQMLFESAEAPKPIAEATPVTKPAQGKKK